MKKIFKLSNYKKLLKNKKMLILIICLVVVTGSVYRFYSLRKSRTTDAAGLPITAVARGNISLSITGTGNIKPIREQKLSPDITSTVKEMYFREGDRVETGDLIYVLSNSDILLELESSRINLDNTMFDYQTTADRIDSLEVKAPISGVIEELNIIEDAILSNGQVIATIIDKSTLKIKAPLNSLQKDKVQVGQSAQVFFASNFTTMEGRVVAVDQSGTPDTGGAILYYAHVVFSNPGGFTEGEQGYVTINTADGDVRAYSAGTVEFNEYREVKAPASVEVDKVLKKQKDYVAKGEVIALLSSDDLKLEQESKDIKVKQAQLEYQNKQQQITSLEVIAQLDGIIAGQDVNVGDEVIGRISSDSNSNSGTGTTTNNYSLGSVLSNEKQVTIPVDELDISKIKTGQKAVVSIEALPGKTYEGSVYKISEIGNVQSGVSTYDVTVIIPEGEGIKSGMTADVEILIANKRDVLLVPVEAVMERNGKHFVMLNQSSQQGKDASPVQVKVEIGLRNENYVEIIDGLSEEDEVMLTGISGVSTQNNRMPGAGGFVMPGGGGTGMPRVRLDQGQGGR